mmetsp:Transcript_16753/g.25175  ORF Transcript_16753/g.25175 Transcript_16753/m.25175 type:complete len:160 (-) Transcript_16753:287-766(-)
MGVNKNLQFILAIENGDILSVKECLKKDCDVNACDKKGRPVIILAVQHEKIVELLLSRSNIEIDARDPLTNATALAFAAGHGHNRTVALLLQNGANVHAVGNRGRGPLHGAALRNHVECVRLLLQYSADPYLKDSEGRTPFSDSQDKNHTKIITLFSSC